MAGTLKLSLFGLLVFLGATAAAPACDKTHQGSSYTRRPARPQGTASAGGPLGSGAGMSIQPVPSGTASDAVPLPSPIGETQPVPSPPASGNNTAPDTPTTPAQGLSLASTLIYDLDNTGINAPTITSGSGVKIDANVYIVDMSGNSAEQIAAYKEAGKTVVCYFSAGTLEPFRDDVKSFDPTCACGPGGTLNSANECVGGSGDSKMDDWNEFWLDIHSPTCKTNVQDVMTKRIQAAKEKGCDGMDPDNVDSYSNGSPHGNTKQDQVDYLLWLSKTIHDAGMIVDLKNSGGLLQGDTGAQLVDAFDFSVIESCAVYNECDIYDPFLAAGKPQIQIEYGSSIKSCPALKPGQNLAVYRGETLDSKKITLNCPGPSA